MSYIKLFLLLLMLVLIGILKYRDTRKTARRLVKGCLEDR